MRTTHQAYHPATGPRRLRILGAACSAAAVAGWLVLGTGPATAAPRMALAAAVATAGPCGAGGFALTAQPGDSEVTLSWCEPGPSPGDSRTLASYTVTEGTNPGGESVLTSVDSATTSYTVLGLTNGTTYYFRVEAVPDSEPVTSSPSTSTPSATPIARALVIQSGIWTNEIPATPQAALLPPGAPSGLTASPGDSRVTLSWTAPEAAGHEPVTGYSIYLGRSPGGESNSPVAQVAGTTADITHLTNGARYYFEVTADSATGASDPSKEISAIPVSATSHKTNRDGHGTGHHHQTKPAPPPPGIVWVIFGAAGLLAAVLLILVIRVIRWLREGSGRGPAPDTVVRVKPAAGPPGHVAIRATGSQPSVTARIDPDAGTRSVLVEEVRS